MPLYRAELRRRKGPLPPVLIHDPSQVLYLPFDKDDGDYARDRSGHANHGTIHGATRVAGKVANALSFDGVDDEVTVPNSPSLLFDSYSILGWIYAKNPSPYNEGILSKIEKTSGWELGWWIRVPARNQLEVKGTDEKDGTHMFTVPAESYFKWMHFAYTYKPGLASVYINGELIHSAKEAEYGAKKLPDPINIGRVYDYWAETYLYFNGLIDEVRIYNRVLSTAEIVKIMNAWGV